MVCSLSDSLVPWGAFASHAAPADTDHLRVRTPPLTPSLSLVAQRSGRAAALNSDVQRPTRCRLPQKDVQGFLHGGRR